MVQLENYSKKIKNKTVLDNITATFESGKIYGLHGRNGSGKTMLLRAISGLIFPTEGTVWIDGRQLHKDMSFPENMGILIENTSLMPMYSGLDNLKILAAINHKISVEQIRNIIKEVGLNPDDRANVRQYSLGMKQKLSIAQAIMEDPSLLLLDEPTNALDDQSVHRIREILLKRREEGAAILIASHNKEDLQVLADEVVEMADGRIQEST